MWFVGVFVLVCIQSSDGYFWQHVNSPGDHPDNTILHSSTSSHGFQAMCRAAVGACGRQSGRVWRGDNTCRIPNNNQEHVFQYGQFEVLATEPIKENIRWSGPTSAQQIREKGVVVDLGCATYVCAHNFYGPGKLKIWSDTRIVCYVASGWTEHEFTSNYQALLMEPPHTYQLTNVNYYLDELSLIGDKPVHLATATFINNDDDEHVVTQTLTYGKSSTSEWGTSAGFVYGTSMSVSAGIPLFVDIEWTISQEQSFQYTYGESHSESIEVSLQAMVTVPGKHACDVSITARQKTMDVPYTASLTTFFEDGSTKTQQLSGVYNGLTVSDDTVQIDKCLPL